MARIRVTKSRSMEWAAKETEQRELSILSIRVTSSLPSTFLLFLFLLASPLAMCSGGFYSLNGGDAMEVPA